MNLPKYRVIVSSKETVIMGKRFLSVHWIHIFTCSVLFAQSFTCMLPIHRKWRHEALSEKHAASENVNPVYREESLSHNDSLLTADKQSISYSIRFSRNFQRFVVEQKHQLFDYPNNPTCIESFAFLDEAIVKYPTASFEPCLDSIGPLQDEDHYDIILAGMGTIPSNRMLQSSSPSTQISPDEIEADEDSLIVVGSEGRKLGRTIPGFQSLEYLAYIALYCDKTTISPPPLDRPGAQRTKWMDYSMVEALGGKISQSRFAAFSTQQIYDNFQKILQLLTCRKRNKTHDTRNQQQVIGLAMNEAEALNTIAAFPQLCLYNLRDLEERITFMTAPFPKDLDHDLFRDPRRKYIQSMELDPFNTMWAGCGCGLSLEQATAAIISIPQLLAMFHEDAKKPSIIYFYHYLKVPMAFIDETRSELSNYISGSDFTDVCAFAYLRTLNVRSDQIKVLLEAMPTLTFCMPEASLRLNSSELDQVEESRLHFLRKRLQLTNADVKAMIKTHARLISYDIKNNILPTLTTIQDCLCLSTRELRKLILRMPSVIGMNVKCSDDGQPSSLIKRIRFFEKEDIKHSLLKQPALLQYGIDSSLRKKLKFLVEEVGVPHTAIGRIIKTAPAVLGLSLDRTLNVTVSSVRERCNFSKEQFGALVATEPYIITLSLKNKIEPTFTVLCASLQISTARELGQFIEAAPRVLLQSIDSSLSPKFELLRKALEIEGERLGEPLSSLRAQKAMASIIKNNPALLTTTLSIFQKRINNYLINNISLFEGLEPRSLGRKRLFAVDSNNASPYSKSVHQMRRKRQNVVELSNDELTIVQTFECVNDAAECLGVSPSSIYLACSRRGRVKNRPFRYSDVEETIQNSRSNMIVTENNQRGFNPNATTLRLHNIVSGIMNLFDSSISSVSVYVFVSSSIYPKDDINLARGSRKAGGIAVHFPQVTSIKFGDQLKLCTEKSFANTMPQSDVGSCFFNGLILCNFPQSRPSRNRCDLYACHSALKLISQLMKRAWTIRKNVINFNVTVHICTDSSYAWRLLHDTERLKGWGVLETLDSLSLEGYPCPMANTDLLLPLAQSYYNMCREYAHNQLSINFCHTFDVCINEDIGYTKKLNALAKNAAAWGYSKY